MKFLAFLALAVTVSAVERSVSDEQRYSSMCAHLSVKNSDIDKASCVTFLKNSATACGAIEENNVESAKAHRACVRSKLVSEYNLTPPQMAKDTAKRRPMPDRETIDKKGVMKNREQKKKELLKRNNSKKDFLRREKLELKQKKEEGAYDRSDLKRMQKAKQKLAEIRKPGDARPNKQQMKNRKKMGGENKDAFKKQRAAKQIALEKAKRAKPGSAERANYHAEKSAKIEEFKRMQKKQAFKNKNEARKKL